MKSKRLPLFAAIGLAIAGFVAAGPARSEDLPVLKLALADGAINPTPDSVLELADRLGFYAKHGVKVELIELQGTPQAVAALNSGAVDLADITIDSAIRLRADNGLPIRGIISLGIGSPFLVAAKPEIKTPADLTGKTFAIANRGSLDQNLTQTWLNSIGMSTDAPSWVPIGPPATRVQALAAGRVDATTVSFGTFLSIKDTPGIHILVTPEDFGKAGPELSKFVATLDTTISAKHEAVQHFVDALIDASRSFAANPDEWVKAMQDARDDLTRENLDATAKFFDRYWCVNGCMNKDMLARTTSYIYGTKDFADVKKLDVGDIVDLSFVANAIKTQGVATGSIDVP
jgi:NitT/TauT family transport system substrate-binding protein